MTKAQQTIPLVRASDVLPVYRFLEQGGARTAALAQRISPLFRGDDTVMPVLYGAQILEEACRQAGARELGLTIALGTTIETFGGWAAIMARSPTLGSFLQAAMAEHRRINTGIRLWVLQRGEESWLHVKLTRALQRGRAEVVEYCLGLWLQELRHYLGTRWIPDEIHVEGPPPPHRSLLDSLAARGVRFHQPTLAIAFPTRALAARAANGSPVRMVAPGAEEPGRDFPTAIRQEVSALLRLGVPELPVAAEVAGMSERSFQRRLREAGLSFRDLVEQSRFETACRMLETSGAKVIEIATELGYSDPANFTRAFRRWSGVSPQEFRRAGVVHAA